MRQNHFKLLAVIVCMIATPRLQAQHGYPSGENYFFDARYHDVYSLGQGRMHYKTVIYAEGTQSNCYASYELTQSTGYERCSYSWFDEDNTHHNAVLFYTNSSNASLPRNKGFARIKVLQGTAVVTNAYDGTNPTFMPDGQWHDVYLQRDSTSNLTILEYDFYFPTRMENKPTETGIVLKRTRTDGSGGTAAVIYMPGLGNYGGDQAPTLLNPIFYAINSNGATGYGNLAVPYVSYQQTYQYYTSWNATHIPSTDQSSMIYVPSADTVIPGFCLTMQTKSSASTTDNTVKQWLQSSKVDIPAYHRIHDMTAPTYTWYDTTLNLWFRDDRFRDVQWKLYYPTDADIVPNDMFELQRAYRSDFSDAQTIATINIDWPKNRALGDTTFHYVDSTRAAWYNPVEHNGNIYYRVRRASAALWGWEGHSYAASVTSMSNPCMLKVANNSRTRYTIDPNFDDNHLCHVRLNIPNYNNGRGDNAIRPRHSQIYWDPAATLYIERIHVETHDTLRFEVPDDTIQAALDRVFYNPDWNTFYYGEINIDITDHLVTPCVHYEYRFRIDTSGIALEELSNNYYTYQDSIGLNGNEPYFTDAATLDNLAGTHEESPEYVLLTWAASEGGVDNYTIEARPNSNSTWSALGTTSANFWQDRGADPSVSTEWQYRVTSHYTCNGNTISDSRTTTGSRSPWGRVSGRVRYDDGSGCPGITVVATRTSDGATVQTTVTDATGHYLLDSLRYGGGVEYAITPTSQTAQFRYNNTSSGSATITLTLSRCVTDRVDFENISAVRLTGRVLYENSSIPVRDANFLLNGILMQTAGSTVKTDANGNFNLRVPSGSPFTLQVVKAGHTFLGDGYICISDTNLLTLNSPLDGVRLWDRTKVRLAGRVCGGLDQSALPVGHGLSHNNLGDNLRLVLELEGDNVSYVVRIPSDLSKDTLEYTVPHLLHSDTGGVDTVGVTQAHYQLRRIVVEPDPVTGEFCVDLFPRRWKITTATAQGYSTLLPATSTGIVIDLGNAATQHDTVRHGSQYATHNSQYILTYRSPISITCKQLRFGMEVDYFGEETIQRTTIQNLTVPVPVASRQPDGTYRYLFGAPVFKSDRYHFRAYAHEDYYYNNDRSAAHDEVRIKGGTLRVYNGMYDSTNTQTFTKVLDTLGSADFSIPVNYASFVQGDTSVQRVLDLSVETEGDYVVSQAVRGYVTGYRHTANSTVTSTHGTIQLLDVLRDPPGSTSSAYIESGAEYSYSYTFDFKFKFGLDIGLTLGTQASGVFGAFAGMGAGMYTGQSFDISHTFSFDLPITSSYNYNRTGTYSFRTNERISTSNSPYDVGQDADVYIGTVQNVYFRRVDAVQPIDSLTYASLLARDYNGTMSTVTQGVAPDGNRYYLVVGQELETGPYLTNSFTYTHAHIRDNIIPQLQQQRDALLLTCDSATAQSIADAHQTAVYRSLVPAGDSNWACPDHYRLVQPTGSTRDWVDEVSSLNHTIADWVNLLIQNEAEKVAAIHYHAHDSVATYSLSNSTTVSRSESYNYSNAYHVYWDYPGASISVGDLVSTLAGAFGKSVLQLIGNAFYSARESTGNGNNPSELLVNAPGSATKFSLTPIIDFNFGRDPVRQVSHSRTIGFTLSPDILGNMDVSIYRMKKSIADFAFNTASDSTRQFVSSGDYDGNSYLYGSLVYYLRGGASRCPCEVADSTHYYAPKMPLSAGSLKLENPRVDINIHERSNVPVDRPAVFTLRIYNETEATVGAGISAPITFRLKMNDASNPHGARVYIDGMPLTDGRDITLVGSQVVTKTMEVYAGDGYDFENLVIELVSTCISTYKGKAQFSVHFMPVSCEVTLSSPRDHWVLNTLSPQDSQGYFIPVSITGFDVNYRNFDHIELQYKISTQGDDSWVNVCSYYDDSTLFQEASGTKAMIVGGRIDNVRFYGERDPIEQAYDLRAVSYCRHGSGFISRASTILSGIKDTRPPRVFGQPQPANGILGVGDNLLLRFNEPIAGNYLDEDNNFQLLGVTNRSGIASSTSVYFDGTPSCGASSAVTRVLSDKSFSIDLMAKPFSSTLTNRMQLFGHSTATGGIAFGIEPAEGGGCRMYAYINNYSVRSLPLLPLTDFRRLVMTYNKDTKEIRFYAGTEDMTDPEAAVDSSMSAYNGNAPLVFGHGFKGNMLEARLWIKALSTEEIVSTHERRLTGYERKLAAYYPMNEGRGNVVFDKANGSTMSLHGAAWTTPDGFSLNLNGSRTVTLDQNVFARSANQDYTLMFWFRTSEYNVPLFSAMVNDSTGTRIGFENGFLTFRNNRMRLRTTGNFANGLWHHYVLTVSRIYNNAAIYVDGQMVNTFTTDTLTGLSGVMQLGGRGHIDDLALFEQALPKSLVEAYDNLSPHGDEMGLVAWLPFSEQRENVNGIMEEVFSINNQRLVRTREGNVVNIVQPLVISPDSATLATMADGGDHAPARERDLLKKMHFNWAFNNDELLININMPDSEINKNNIYITVRNVEDLNGNRTESPIMWQVYANKNTLVWNSDGIAEVFYEHAGSYWEIPVQFINTSGRRHQYTIEGLPDWLHVDQSYGSINPEERLTASFSVDESLPVGIYSEIIYLTDEDGLSEPLKVYIQIKAVCPWDYINEQAFDRQMSLRGQVMVDGIYDSDPQDIVAAKIGNKLVGLNNVSFDQVRNTSYIYQTIFGTAEDEGKPVTFLLWQASTGRIYRLTPSEQIVFEDNGMAGLPPSSPILLSTSANEVQVINIEPGWNWISFNIKPDNQGAVDGLFFTYQSFTPGDQIKSAADRQFAEYDGQQWTGSLTNVTHKQMYMLYTQGYHSYVQVSGRRLSTEGDRSIYLKNGWNSMPFLLTADQPLTVALADYIDHASVGDLIKSQNAFAVFSENQRWEGSLTSMSPGRGYLLQRQGQDSVKFTFRSTKGSSSHLSPLTSRLSPTPATNMTVIATVQHPSLQMRVHSYVSGTLTGTTAPQVVDGDTLFFITLGTDKPGEVTFVLEEDGTVLGQTQPLFPCRANAHHGSLKQPVMLTFGSLDEPSVKAYPTLFDDHVDFFISGCHQPTKAAIVLRDAVGREILAIPHQPILNSQFSILNLQALPAGVYFATVNLNNSTTTLKLVKK